jgi:hypothetical protein
MAQDPHILASNILALFPKPREKQNDWQEMCEKDFTAERHATAEYLETELAFHGIGNSQ